MQVIGERQTLVLACGSCMWCEPATLGGSIPSPAQPKRTDEEDCGSGAWEHGDRPDQRWTDKLIINDPVAEAVGPTHHHLLPLHFLDHDIA